MARENWSLEDIRTAIDAEFAGVEAADFVKMNEVLYSDNIGYGAADFERMYVSEAAEKLINDLADKDLSDAKMEDLDAYATLLENFSSRNNDRYVGRAEELNKKIEDRREVLNAISVERETSQNDDDSQYGEGFVSSDNESPQDDYSSQGDGDYPVDEADQDNSVFYDDISPVDEDYNSSSESGEFLTEEQQEAKLIENMTPAELWEYRKSLEQAPEKDVWEQERVDNYIAEKANEFANSEIAILDMRQYYALKGLLEAVKENPYGESVNTYIEGIDKTLDIVNDHINDFEAEYGLGDKRVDDAKVAENWEMLSHMPYDEDLFARDDEDFQAINNILNNLQIEGELNLLGREHIEQKGSESDIALFKERIRTETENYLANTSSESITEDVFKEEYSTRLKKGIIEIVYADAVSKGYVRQSDMEELFNRLSDDVQSGYSISVNQSTLAGWQAARDERDTLAGEIMHERGLVQGSKTFLGKLKSLREKCQKKYPVGFTMAKGALTSFGWGTAFKIGATLCGPTGMAAVATASCAYSSYKLYKGYKQEKKKALENGEKLKFFDYLKKNKLQAAGVLFSATGMAVGGMNALGAFVNNPALQSSFMSARATTGIALGVAGAFKQAGKAYNAKDGSKRQKAWAAAKAFGVSAVSFGAGILAGRSAGELIGIGAEGEALQQEQTVQETQTEEVLQQEQVVQETQTEEALQQEQVVQETQTEATQASERVVIHHHPYHDAPTQGSNVESGNTVDNVTVSENGQDNSDDSPINEEQGVDEEVNSVEGTENGQDNSGDSPINEEQGVDEEINSVEGTGNGQDNSDDSPINEGQPEPAVKPLFNVEGQNEDGSFYGHTEGGREVSGTVIDEDGNILRMTVDGQEFSEEQLDQINNQPSNVHGLEDRAQATVESAEALRDGSPTGMAVAENDRDSNPLEGAGKGYSDQRAGNSETPRSPGYNEGENQDNVSATQGHTPPLGSLVELHMVCADRASSLGFEAADGLGANEYRVNGNTTVGKDTDGNVFRLTECTINGQSRVVATFPDGSPYLEKIVSAAPAESDMQSDFLRNSPAMQAAQRSMGGVSFDQNGRNSDNLAQLSSELKGSLGEMKDVSVSAMSNGTQAQLEAVRGKLPSQNSPQDNSASTVRTEVSMPFASKANTH